MNLSKFLANIFKKEQGWQTVFGIGTEGTVRNNRELYFGIVYSCIDAIATAVSENEWGLYRKKGNGKYEKVEKHPILSLLQRPNKLQSATDFFYLMSTYIDIAGQSFIYPVRTSMASGNIVELHQLNADAVVTMTNAKSPITEILGYRYSKDGLPYLFKNDEIINVIRPNPYKQHLGISTIQMSRFDATNELNAIDHNNAFYDNGASPSGVVSTEMAMDKDNFDKVKAKLKEQYEGKKNHFRMMFLTHGFNYKQISPTQRDMQYIEQRKLNRDQILAIFKVPKSIVAVSDQVNKSVAEEENKAFTKNVVKPRLDVIFDKLNMFLLPLFPDTEDLELRYENPVPEDAEFDLKHKSTSVNVWKTVNEVRDSEGLPPVEGGDVLPLTNLLNINSDEQNSSSQSGKDSKKEPKKSLNEAFAALIKSVSKPPVEDKKEENGTDGENNHDHEHKIKETLPAPSDSKSPLGKKYLERKNKYIKYKEANLALKIEAHFSDLVNQIRKQQTKSNVESDNDSGDLPPEEAFEKTPEKIFEKVMPDQEQRKQWETTLFLLLLTANSEVWKTVLNQLKDVFGFTGELNEQTAAFIASRSNFTSKSVKDTAYKKIKDVIATDIGKGVTDLRQIKKDIAFLLADQKEWKADQIAQTEVAWAYGEAQYKTYRDNGVKKLIWLTGSAPCEICAGNSGEIVDIGKTFSSGHIHEPVHPNCKCSVEPHSV